MPYGFTLFARALEIAEKIEEAVTQSDAALEIVEKTGVRWLAAELHRHKGELLLRLGQPDAAEELYRKALGIAEGQGAKLWELRAAASLARLHRDQGRHAEARDLRSLTNRSPHGRCSRTPERTHFGSFLQRFRNGFRTCRPNCSQAVRRLPQLARAHVARQRRGARDETVRFSNTAACWRRAGRPPEARRGSGAGRR